jgi:hypothetical protein
MSSMLIHVDMADFFATFKKKLNSILFCEYTHFFIHSFVNEHLSCFHILTTINSVAKSIKMYFFEILISVLLDNCPEVRLLIIWCYGLNMKSLSKKLMCWPSTMAHACNPNYTGGGNQEDCGSGPAQAKS